MAKLIILLPLLLFISLYLYRFDGKRQLLRFDLIQFLYAFVVLPLVYLWFKTFIFLLLKNQVQTELSVNDLFIIDTVISLIFLFISSFVVIHSLTKSFNLQRQQDPLFDLYELSEYFHLTFSHFVIYGGGLLIMTLISTTNIFLPLATTSAGLLYAALGLGVLAGCFSFMSVGNYRAATRSFRRIMKLFYSIGFIIHALIYFIFDPRFTPAYGLYWAVFSMFMTLVLLTLFVHIDWQPKEEKNAYTITLQIIRFYWNYFKKLLIERLR